MTDVLTKEEITKKCREVFDKLGLTKKEVGEAMGCSDVAVGYMIDRPDRGMSDLRRRFLARFADVEVQGPGFVASDEPRLTPGQVCEEFGLPPDVVSEAINDGELPTTMTEPTDEKGVGYVLYSDAQGFALNYEPNGDDE